MPYENDLEFVSLLLVEGQDLYLRHSNICLKGNRGTITGQITFKNIHSKVESDHSHLESQHSGGEAGKLLGV